MSKDAESAGGRLLGKEYTFAFNVGNDAARPEITGVFAVDRHGETVFPLSRYLPEEAAPAGTVAENAQWENIYSLLFEFS